MPQLDRAAFEGSELHRIQSQVVTAEEVRVMVFATDDVLFRRFVDASYDSHVYKWEAHHPVGSFRVSREEWMRYAFTALRSRIARINDDHGHIRSDQEWQIPAMIATVLNAIGRVTIDGPAMIYVPIWNPEYDAMVLSFSEWSRTTAKLRALAEDREYAKFIFVRSLTGDRTGDRMIMDLIPVRDEVGRVIRLHSHQPVDGVAAFVYLACGFMPDIFEGVDLETHPMMLPRRYIDTNVVEYGAEELGLRSA